ncbi:hypothetical protein H6F88_29730 [Oculatella sp. FACHB-28]|uniref:hypothetical protein n=1 Tax=Cyanophyceae TaxID=3028117 RepID=UPI00168271B4|nr:MULTISPECIES: hypothetical protein [Cyanophyceae]MBD1868584.1 hypothetical protein [Cyanobacteria bacterium FACHB-471]MBD2000447.1 hypothetical protein [Leptolyngbya sp. FACHB-541]MBD2060126.1 hypothetical protein [Oculatella sp. FACHB-28]MBD2066809.1 hypothetical protein [Leptolyngbya sp. FACHB-671]
MQDKHKVTLYLPPELHRQLKIRSAVDAEPMSAIAERAIVFYLTHSDVVDEVEMSHGQVYQVYDCPECSSSVVLQEGKMISLKEQPSILVEEGLSPAIQGQRSGSSQQGEEELVPC